MDHERYPDYFEGEGADTGGRFIAELYEMLVNAISRLAVPPALARSR